MKSGNRPGRSDASRPGNVSAPKFHLFQSVTVYAERCPFPPDYGRVIGVVFDPEEHLQCQWWYVVEFPEGCDSSPWVAPGYKDEIPESDITQRELTALALG